MIQLTTLTPFSCIICLLLETLWSLTLEAEAGDKVTIWCQHDLDHQDRIFWFKQTSDSVPLLLGCKQFKTSAPSEPCYFFTESEKIVMSVHGKNTSLTITAVNVSDTGLYYCSYIDLDRVKFSNSTSLHVKDNTTLSMDVDRKKVSYGVFFILTMILAPLIMILLGVLIFNILKHRKMHKGDNPGKQDKEEQEPDAVNYAALQFSKKKTTRTERYSEIVDSHIVYSAIKQ